MLVGLARLELATSALSGLRSNHLSYRPGMTIVMFSENELEIGL
jgi:hypothetical protein